MSDSSKQSLAVATLGGAVTRQFSTFDRASRNKTISVRRGQRVTIADVRGEGYIAQFWLTFPGWFWQHWAVESPISHSILKTLILRISFDDAAEPAVAAPIGDFFGNGLCEISNFASRFLGMSSGGFYCAFPMPFRKGFRIEIENVDETIDTDIFCNVLYQFEALPADVGYFHAQFRTGENRGPDDVELVALNGRGRYVGCTLSMQGRDRNYLSFLEAPEFVQVDDDWESPRLTGTGLEDYFLGGWYFREGEFIGPMHGVPSKDTLNASIAMYRTHDADAIHFQHRLRFTFRTLWDPERLKPFRYSCVGFAYLNQPAGQGVAVPPREKLLCWYRVKSTDHQSVP